MLDYKIALYIKGIYDLEFHETEISLGTQTKETLDRSYDNSSLELLLTDIKEEFQPYTPAVLFIYTTDEDGKVKDAIYHHLVIEGDEISDVYIGTNTKYNHKITLIEATKILETELMPNITFTQPVKNTTIGLEYALEMEKLEAPTIALSGLGFEGGFQALVAVGTILGGAVAGLAIGLAIGNAAGPWGLLIGAIAGLVIGSVIDIVFTIKDQDARLLRDFINALDFKHNIPDDFSALLIPGAKLPDITVNFTVDGYLDTVNRYFGEGGVWEAIGMGLSVINTIQTIIKAFAWLIDSDDTISFKIPPAAILLTNMDTAQTWALGSADKITKESDASTLGFTLAKITYYGIKEIPTVPEDLPEGNYSLLYTFIVEDLWVRDFEWWPFDMHWNDMKINEKMTIDGVEFTLGEIINGCSIIAYQNLYYDKKLNDLVKGKVQAEYSTQPIYMDELLTRIENQIKCRDMIPTVKMKPEWYEDTAYDLQSGEEVVYLKSYASKPRMFSRPTESLGINAIFLDKLNYTDFSRYNQAKLKADIDVLFLDQNKEYISLYQTSNTVIHTDNVFNVNTIVPVPDGAQGYKINIKLSKPVVLGNTSIDKNNPIIGDINELDLDQIFFDNASNIKEDKYRPAKYTFSERARSLSHVVCPEFTFEGKTLWEICLEIGEIFHGIPVLREGNIIDFYIVDDNEKKVINFDKEAETKIVNMTNYATKLYTPELKGIVQDDIAAEEGAYCTYPYPGGWIKVRANDYFSTVIDRQTSAIVIENENTGIYKLKEVWCKCPVKKDGEWRTQEFNITNYVLEKEIYDTLSEELDVSWGAGKSTSEKGTFAYYIQGKNCIYNLAQLPDNRSIKGWKQTHLTVQFLLNKQFGISLDDTSNNILDYEFQVKYVPTHSRLNISRQTNLSNIGNQITNNFNQNANVVSATAFSKFADNTLNRLGNPEILTSYTTRDLIDGINIGDCLELNGKNYYVNTKLNTYNNNDKTVQLSLTKDNYKQNDRIAVSREHRQYNIDSDSQVRKTLSKPFTLIVSNEPIRISEDSSYIRNYSSKNKQLIARSIAKTLNRNKYSSFNRLTNAFVSFYDENKYPLHFNRIFENKAPTKVVDKIIPVIGECLGNTLTFQWDMYDNFSAGRKINDPLVNTKIWLERLSSEFNHNLTINDDGTFSPTGSTPTKIIEGDFGVKLQNDCRYCDDFGGCPKIYTSIFSVGANTTLGNDYSSVGPDTGYNKSSLTEYIAENELSFDLIANKDSREKLSFQTTISAQTFDKDIDIYSLMKVNPLVTELNYTSAKWYGYTKYNQPDDSGIYTPYKYYELKSIITGPLEIAGDPYVRQQIQNKTNYDFIGYILVAQYGDSKPEVLLNIRKPLYRNEWTSVYYTVFDDEISLSDTEYVAFEELDSVDFDEFIPEVYLSNNKFYVDIKDLEDKTGLTYKDINIALVTKHTTRGRAIPDGYHGRKYQKYKNGESLYHTSNTYCGNPYRTTDKAGNIKIMEDFRFNKITVGADGQLLCDDKQTKSIINFYDYLIEKNLSRQDYGRGRRKSTYLLYGFRAINTRTKLKSNFKTNFKVDYNERIPVSISTTE